MELLVDSNQVPARRLTDDELNKLSAEKYRQNLVDALRQSTFVGHVRNESGAAVGETSVHQSTPGHYQSSALQQVPLKTSSAHLVCSRLEQTYTLIDLQF